MVPDVGVFFKPVHVVEGIEIARDVLVLRDERGDLAEGVTLQDKGGQGGGSIGSGSGGGGSGGGGSQRGGRRSGGRINGRLGQPPLSRCLFHGIQLAFQRSGAFVHVTPFYIEHLAIVHNQLDVGKKGLQTTRARIRLMGFGYVFLNGGEIHGVGNDFVVAHSVSRDGLGKIIELIHLLQSLQAPSQCFLAGAGRGGCGGGGGRRRGRGGPGGFGGFGTFFVVVRGHGSDNLCGSTLALLELSLFQLVQFIPSSSDPSLLATKLLASSRLPLVQAQLRCF